jgi:hypothetical protein
LDGRTYGAHNLIRPEKKMANTHTHTLTFTGSVLDNEMDRAPILGHAKVREARDALIAAFEEAGAPHTFQSAVVKPRQTRGPRKPKVTPVGAGRAAAE